MSATTQYSLRFQLVEMHGAPVVASFIVSDPMFHAEIDFGVLNEHAGKPSDPGPEKGSWSSDLDSGDNPDDIPDPNTASNGGKKGFQGVDARASYIFMEKREKRVENRAEFADLEKAGAE